MSTDESIYEISKSITVESMLKRRGQISPSEIKTSEYLRRLENAPRDPRDEFKRYKG